MGKLDYMYWGNVLRALGKYDEAWAILLEHARKNGRLESYWWLVAGEVLQGMGLTAEAGVAYEWANEDENDRRLIEVLKTPIH